MAVHWTIQFRSLRADTLYTISIYDNEYNGTAIPLVGGAVPISTKENESEDVFLPVRTQTGYIRIIDNGKDANGNAFNWRDLMPASDKSRPVTLSHMVNNTTVCDWMGFIEPQTFSGNIYDNVQEREFPICDWLSSIKGDKVAPTNAEAARFNFAYLIDYVLGYPIPELEYNYHFDGGAAVYEWLRKGVSWGIFHDVDSDNHVVSRYNCQQLLEEICKFFGWTCRQQGADVFFESDANVLHSWYVIDNHGLHDIAVGETPTVYSIENTTTIQGIPGSFVDTKNKVLITRGWKKSAVTAKVDKNNDLVEYPDREIEKHYRSIQILRELAGDGLYQFFRNTFDVIRTQGYETIDCTDVTVTLYATSKQWHADEVVEEYGHNITVYGYGQINMDAFDNNMNPHSVTLSNDLWLYHGADAPGDGPYDKPLALIKTNRQYSVTGGKIVLSAKTTKDQIDTTKHPAEYRSVDANGYIVMSVKFGDKYYNGTTWTTEPSSFQVGASSQIVTNRRWDEPYPNYDGLSLNIEGVSLGGYIEIYFWEFYDSDAENHLQQRYDPEKAKACRVTDFKLSFIRSNSEPEQKERSENKYIIESASPFKDEKDVSLLFFTDNNNQFAENIVFNPNGSYCTELEMDGANIRPEQHLVNRMSAWGAVTHDLLSVNTDTGNAAGTITPQCVVAEGGKRYAPLSISRNWRDDAMEVKYIELIN